MMAGNSRTFRYFATVLATAVPVTMMLLSEPNRAADASEARPMNPQRTTPPARDPEIAVEEEYQIARQRTAQALELFIARHPDSPLAERARADLRRRSR